MNEELSHCCKAPKEVSHADEGTACYVCAKCKQEFLTPEDFDQALPDLYIAGQIAALEWLLMNRSGGVIWRRLCEQKISQLNEQRQIMYTGISELRANQAAYRRLKILYDDCKWWQFSRKRELESEMNWLYPLCLTTTYYDDGYKSRLLQ